MKLPRFEKGMPQIERFNHTAESDRMQYEVSDLALSILEQPHTLIAGTTGCGKTTLINSVIYAALAKNDCALILIDPKQTELRQYRKTKACQMYANTSTAAVDALNLAIRVMKQRQRKMMFSRQTESNEQHLYIIIDELADLLLSDEAKEIKTAIIKLTQLARSANIHIIAATQQPSKKVLSADLQLNFTARVGLACSSPVESRQIIGVDGCELLPIPKKSQNPTRYCYYKEQRDLVFWEVPYTSRADLDSLISKRNRLFAF